MRCLVLLIGLFACPASAHEFWIEPLAYQVSPDGTLEADIVNGEEFAGLKLAYLPQRFENFILFTGNKTARVKGRPGDKPALRQDPVGTGLHIAAYQSQNATVGYDDWDSFQRFVDHKGFGDVAAQHAERGLAPDGFREVYSRYAKTLIGVGHSAGTDRRVGLETEIVALTNPYTDDLTDGISVQLHYQDTLRPDTQVEVFEKAPDARVTVSFYRTDAEGIATFPVRPGYRYMVDAVVLRVPAPELAAQTDAVWETLWANLTFAVPQ